MNILVINGRNVNNVAADVVRCLNTECEHLTKQPETHNFILLKMDKETSFWEGDVFHTINASPNGQTGGYHPKIDLVVGNGGITALCWAAARIARNMGCRAVNCQREGLIDLVTE